MRVSLGFLLCNYVPGEGGGGGSNKFLYKETLPQAHNPINSKGVFDSGKVLHSYVYV